MKLKPVDQIDFGPTDARHLLFASPDDMHLFGKVFLKPANVDERKFLDGRKSIIYGIKGAGKSAWLKYLELSLGDTAMTKFVYFRKETDRFFDQDRETPVNSVEVMNVERLTKTEVKDFWRTFIGLLISDAFRSSTDKWALTFRSEVSRIVGRDEGWLNALSNRVPVLKSFTARLEATHSGIEVTGEFTSKAVRRFDDDLFAVLSNIQGGKPLYIFFDEMEVSFTSSNRYGDELLLISSLVETIRDLNEIFRRCGAKIFLIAAIRKEIANNISGGDVSKIINDLGQEIIWSRRSWSSADSGFVHPLFEIILRRIAFSDDRTREDFTPALAQAIIKERFPSHVRSGNIQKDILDLTMYRPRDCALLFNVAQQVDAGRLKFRAETFKIDYAVQYSSRLWVDIKEALQAKYSTSAIAGIRQILSGLPNKFSIIDFFDEVDNQSYDPAVSELSDLTSAGMINVLKDLFELGAIGNITTDSKVRFRFRGQTSLLVGKTETIVVHQALEPEFR